MAETSGAVHSSSCALFPHHSTSGSTCGNKALGKDNIGSRSLSSVKHGEQEHEWETHFCGTALLRFGGCLLQEPILIDHHIQKSPCNYLPAVEVHHPAREKLSEPEGLWKTSKQDSSLFQSQTLLPSFRDFLYRDILKRPPNFQNLLS